MPERRQLANAVRFLSIDAVQKANSGHPGMPMGMADMAQVLWSDFLSHNPKNPRWINRDRFVLSNGHGSMLLYSLLHLTGYDLSIEDLKNFRQLHAKTPGHPELGYAPGIETTTGPLGQGIANAVGMAIAETALAAEFNEDDHDIIDHHTYVFCGDGCLMEGVSHEACSLAGTLGLGKLIVLWDDNGISIDGEVQAWFGDDTAKRFEAYGWQVIRDIDGHDPKSIAEAIQAAKSYPNKPSLLCCKTVIGFGAPTKAGTSGAHGAPLGEAEISETRKALHWPHGPFEVPNDIRAAWDQSARGLELENAWKDAFAEYRVEFPNKAAELLRRMSGELPTDWASFAKNWIEGQQVNGEKIATRKASQVALENLYQKLPELMGGSADLTGSNLTKVSASTIYSPEKRHANYIYYGVREFGMSAIMNGLALHGGFIPYGGTFLVFTDYARNAIRMSALMKQRVIYVMTHDSIGLGEDGPTHQPVEHVASLRLIPNLSVWRPADDVETAVAWEQGIEQKQTPTLLALSRQGLPHLNRDASTLANVRKGGYILKAAQKPGLILMASGSEVSLAMDSAAELAKTGLSVSVVSMPSMDAFEKQSADYKASVLPKGVPAVAIEAGVSESWLRYTGSPERVIGMNQFGESAPADELFKHFGFTVDNVCRVAQQAVSEAATV